MNICVAHVDLDQFFVAVERLKNKSLIGKPVVVGGSPDGRGVVSSASYEARKYGIRSAMPTGIALRKCKDLIVVSSDFGDYKEKSAQVFEIIGAFSPVVERTGIDEGYIDLAGCQRYYGKSPIELAEDLRNRILKEAGLIVSVGISTNRMMAKIASNHSKPNGILEILPGYERRFLAPLDVRVMPGIGPKTEERLKKMGFNSLGDIAASDEKILGARFGVLGPGLVRRARGESRGTLQLEHKRKSVGHERTFSKDVMDPEKLMGTIHHLSSKVASRLRKLDMGARVVRVKIRYSDFRTISRSITFTQPTQSGADIYSASKRLAAPNLKEGVRVRLVGVSVSGLSTSHEQLDIFLDSGARRDRLTEAADKIHEKYNFKALITADSLRSKDTESGNEEVTSAIILSDEENDGRWEGE